MKNIYLNVGFLSLIFLFSQCTDQFSVKKKTPDASFICTYSANGTVIANNATITIHDKVTFTSKGTFNNCGMNFALYSGASGYKYQPYYVMNGSTPKQTSDLQSARGAGVLLDTLGGKFVSNAMVFDVGTYTVYCVASFVDKKTGDYKQAIDSLVINVIDPKVSSTVPTSFTLSSFRMSDLMSTSIDTTNKYIIFKDVTSKPSRFASTNISYISPDLHMSINGVAIISSTKYNFSDGTIVHITSKDGTKSTDYTVKIYYYVPVISKDPTITAASVTGSYNYSGTAIVVGTKITLPSWPIGSTQVKLSFSVAGKDSSVSITSFPYTLVTLAQDNATKMTYTVNAPVASFNASILAFAIKNSTTAHITVSGKTYSVFTDTASLKKGIISLTLNPFATVLVDSLGTGFHNFNNASTVTNLFKYPSISLKVCDGTDTTTITVKSTPW